MSVEPDPQPSDDVPGTAPQRRRRAKLDDTPRIPRRAGFKISTGQLVKIGMTLALLVMLLLVQRQCADSVSTFVTSFGEEGSGSAAKMPKPGNVDVTQPGAKVGGQYLEQMPENMTKAEYEAMVARARARAGSANAGSGSAGSGSAGGATGSGSAGSGSAGTGSAGSGSADSATTR